MDGYKKKQIGLFLILVIILAYMAMRIESRVSEEEVEVDVKEQVIVEHEDNDAVADDDGLHNDGSEDEVEVEE